MRTLVAIIAIVGCLMGCAVQATPNPPGAGTPADQGVDSGVLARETTERKLVKGVARRPPFPSSTHTPGSTLIGPDRPTILAGLDEARQETGPLMLPTYLLPNVGLEQIREEPIQTGGMTLIYSREPRGTLVSRLGISVHPSGLLTKNGTYEEVSFESGGRAALIQGGWGESGWEPDSMLAAVSESAEGEFALMYAMPADAWDMHEIRAIAGSLQVN